MDGEPKSPVLRDEGPGFFVDLSADGLPPWTPFECGKYSPGVLFGSFGQWLWKKESQDKSNKAKGKGDGGGGSCH